MTPARLSPRSQRVRQARRLLRRAGRDQAGLFLAEGPQALREAVAAGAAVEVFTTAYAAQRHADLLAGAAAAGVEILAVDDEALALLAETVTPQGLVAVCRSVTVPLHEALAGAPALVAVLAAVRDPGNAGTVTRCADAAGADAVVLARGCVDPHNGKAVRASAGSLFHLPVATGPALADVVAACRRTGLTVLAADGAGELDLDRAEALGLLARPAAWLFGNEAWGMPLADRALADHVVRVPIHGRAESLNLATAAAVCLYASARAQRAPGGCRAGRPGGPAGGRPS